MSQSVRNLLVSVLIVALAAPLAAQDWKGRGRLQGKVVDPDGKPYEGARITLHMEGDPQAGPEPFVTDKKGRWSFLGLTGGTWKILIETDEYQLSEGTFQVSEFGNPPPIEVRLKAPTYEQVQSHAVDFVDRGNELLQAGQYAEARAQYEQALATIDAANRPAVYRGIAQTYLQEEQPAQALATLEKALEAAPDDVTNLKLIVSVYLAEGRNREAEVYMARLPAGAKVDAVSRLNLGIELYNANDLDGALEHFNQVIVDFPDEPDGYYYRGLTYLGQQKSAEGAADFKKFLELAPDSPRAEEAKQFLEYLEGQ